MSFIRKLTAFSENGEYLAYSSPDGCLKIWESSTGLLKQEYTPSSHLSATCSSIAWGPCAKNHHSSKKLKKSKNEAYSTICNLQLLAMGTLTGDILLYSFANADLHASLTNGHTSIVNAVVWYSNDLYSCSNDHHIIIWNVTTGKIKTKWKANTGAIYSLCVLDDNNVLSASTSIQWWDVKQKTIIKTFNGHGTEIFKLMAVNFKDSKYVLSTAVGDRVINTWQISEKCNTSAVASFVLSDEPTYIDILAKEDEVFQMSAVSQDGIFHFFDYVFNGKCKKPLQPKFTVQIALKANDGEKPSTLPILAAFISDGLDFCLLSYGTFLKPAFERIDLSMVSNDLFLIRSLSLFSSTSFGENVTKVKQTEKPSDVKILAPGHMIDINFSEKSLKKRKQVFTDIKDLPMEERLKALDLSKNSQARTTTKIDESITKSESMVHLLLQGLQSKDNNMLATVLTCADETVISNTIKRLPLQSIFPLLKLLYERMSCRESRNHSVLKWFTALLSLHLSYFMSCPDISHYLLPFDQLIAAKKEVACKLLQAHGILKLLMTQAASCLSDSTESPSKPLLEYESESTDDESDAEMNHSDNDSDDENGPIASAESSDSSESEGNEFEDEM